ncbi:uracil-DNA glycosylase-like [Bolinopsis microptera]|uniref:uracil-DNA glycosylase-like n=1 Tax=Bolinopsis microptera TaxID=2820187 RepID=UPI00307A354E
MAQAGISSFFKRKRELEDAEEKDNQTCKVLKCSDNLVLKNWDISSSWEKCLSNELAKDYFTSLTEYLAKIRLSKTIYPAHEDVFSWTRYCNLDDVKVVILGQDPYHGPNQAHGLSFSVKIGVPTPPSLKNIYKAIAKDDVDDFDEPGHGYLVGWARQGVLMLNSVLTVEKGKANSHKNQGWEKLTDHVTKYMGYHMKNCVFLLWGSPAIKKMALINKSKHLVLTSVHPSPLSAHKGFFDCKHFSKANEYLRRHEKATIDWNKLPKE